MRQRGIVIRAESKNQALSLAARTLDTELSNISLQAQPGGGFFATLINDDADVAIAVADDGLTAIISEFQPHIGEGRPLTLSGAARAIAAAGVKVPPDPEVLRGVLEDMQKGKDVKGRVVARSIPPKPAEDAQVEPLGDWNFPVYPSDAIGELIPATEAKDGISVTGLRVPFQGQPRGRSISFPDRSFCFIDQKALLIRSETYGLVNVRGQDIRIIPLFEMSRDSMELRLTIYPKDFKGNPVDPERLQMLLDSFKITEKLDIAALAAGQAEAKAAEREVRNVVICKGKQPKDGKDGWFEKIYQDEGPSVGTVSEDGRMDYRPVNMIRSVQENDTLGRLHPPKPGSPGNDIFGRLIPAKEGIPFPLLLGENVKQADDESSFAASAKGMVCFARNLLSVTDVFQVQGDVDMSYGNIFLEKGSVHIRGAVLSGLTITSPRNVVVDEVIESANITAGGSVEVRGGIIMGVTGKITAEGDISALYAQNAAIQTHGTLFIAHEITNCVVHAQKKVVAVRGRGKVICGVIRCGDGLEAREVGSEIGMATTIHLGFEVHLSRDLPRRKKELKQTLQKIYAAMGAGEPRSILAATPPDKRGTVANILKTRLGAEHEIKEIEQQQAAEREEVRRAAKARVKALKCVHPGTVIHSCGSTLTVTETLPPCWIYYEPSENGIIVAPLQSSG